MGGGKVPKLSVFSRDEKPAKHEASYEQWLFEMRSIQHTYAEPQIKEAIHRSIKGVAAGFVHALRHSTAVSKILRKGRDCVW